MSAAVKAIPIICCDECNDIFAYDIEPCPVCGKFQHIIVGGEQQIGKTIQCEDCETMFEFTEYDEVVIKEKGKVI